MSRLRSSQTPSATLRIQSLYRKILVYPDGKILLQPLELTKIDTPIMTS